MTRILAIFCVGAAALTVSACDGIGRKYPPGYTDEGIKFSEENWRYFFTDQRIAMSYFPITGEAGVTIRCDLPDGSALQKVLARDQIEITTGQFAPLQQWPQPDLQVTIGTGQAAEQATLIPAENGNPRMSITIDRRARNQLLRGIHAGRLITLSFADQIVDIPGPPKSMREAFATKCRGEG